MNVFLIMLFIAVGIGCIWWLNRKHEENEAHQRIEKYIQEKEKEIQSDSIKKSEPNPSKVELSAENLQTISNTHESISQEESIEIRPDGTWICPNDETINSEKRLFRSIFCKVNNARFKCDIKRNDTRKCLCPYYG